MPIDHESVQEALCPCVTFTEDFRALTSGQVELLLEQAKQCGYRKPANANGSTAWYFFEAVKRRINAHD